ncbi:MAG: nucleotidyltransferase domain-containing protein [Clostridia bacterium]|nr:nucleotidyltransferase domain-containing protein [Clostridia bacterium]
MCSRSEVQAIIDELRDSLAVLFPRQHFDIILFGSHARDEATEDSDIDVMFLLDAPRETIAEKGWQIGEIAANLLLAHGVVVSPIVENRDYFLSNINTLPFFRNIQREGVRMSA